MAKAGSSLPPIVLEPWTRRRVVAAWGISGGGMLLEDGVEPLSWKKTQVAAPISNKIRTIPLRIIRLFLEVFVPFARISFFPHSGQLAGSPLAMGIIWLDLLQYPQFGHLYKVTMISLLLSAPTHFDITV